MKFIAATICLLMIGVKLCTAQVSEKTPLNALSLELGKTGLIFNIAYDHRFKGKNFGSKVNIGFHKAQYLTLLTAGAGGYYLIGKDKNFLELGLDLNYLSVDDVSEDVRVRPLVYPNYTVNTWYAALNIGYRLYANKTIFRIGMSPGFIKNGFVPGGYVSVGFTF